MTVVIGTPAAGALLVRDLTTAAPGDVLAALRRDHGAPASWAVSVGTVVRVVDSAENIEVHAQVTGAFTGECRLTAGAVRLAAAAVDLGANEVTEVRFRLRPDGRRAAWLSRAVP